LLTQYPENLRILVFAIIVGTYHKFLSKLIDRLQR